MPTNGKRVNAGNSGGRVVNTGGRGQLTDRVNCQNSRHHINLLLFLGDCVRFISERLCPIDT